MDWILILYQIFRQDLQDLLNSSLISQFPEETEKTILKILLILSKEINIIESIP